MKIFTSIMPLLLITTPFIYAQQMPAMEKLHWLIGTWALEKKVDTYEAWKITNDSTLTGRSYKVNGSDTLVSETVEIIRKQQEIWYIPTVSNQNEGKPVSFKLITHDPVKLTFENKAHDFPNRINYFKEGNHAMHVWIEGMIDGHTKKVSFDMKRIH
jgi:hypothetical protein